MTLLFLRASRIRELSSPLTEAKHGHRACCLRGEGLGRIQIAAGAMDTMGSRDTLYAIGGQFFQSSFHAFWRSVDGGETWDAQITRLTGPQPLGYTVTGADNGGRLFGICALKLIQRMPTACLLAVV